MSLRTMWSNSLNIGKSTVLRMVLALVVAFAAPTLVGIQHARAATIEQFGSFSAIRSVNTPDASGGFSDGFSLFNRFDDSLGTLTGVTLEVTTTTFTVEGSVSAAQITPLPVTIGQTVTATAAEAGTFGGGVVFTPTDNVFSDAASCDTAPSCTASFGPTSPTTLPSGVGLFTEPGQLLFFLATSFPLQNTFSAGGRVNIDTNTVLPTLFGNPLVELESVFGQVEWSAQTRLTYEFAPVPIPAAVWLFVSGLGLLGWIGRRN